VLEVCLICRPLASQWDPNVEGLCGNQIASFVAIETSGMLLDVAILDSLVVGLSHFQTSLRKKLVIVLLLDAGAMYVDTDHSRPITDIISEYLLLQAFDCKHSILHHPLISRTRKAT
jgi:hypothetical protein